MLFSHHIKLNGFSIIFEKLFIIPIIPLFIYGAISIATHTTGIMPNIYKNSFIFSLSLVIYSFSLKYSSFSNGDI